MCWLVCDLQFFVRKDVFWSQMTQSSRPRCCFGDVAVCRNVFSRILLKPIAIFWWPFFLISSSSVWPRSFVSDLPRQLSSIEIGRQNRGRKVSNVWSLQRWFMYLFWNLVRTAACRKDRSALKNNTTMWRERTKLVIVVIGSSPQEECRREENEKSTREKIEFFSTSLKLVIDILVYVITYEVPIFYYYFHNGKRFGFPSS